MELLSIIFIWPFLVFAGGLAYIAFFDSLTPSHGHYSYPYGLFSLFFSFWWVWLILLFVLFRVARKNLAKGAAPQTMQQQIKVLREFVLIITISLLVPIFTKYFLDAFDNALGIVILTLCIAFGLITWGVFSKGNKVIMYSNVIGGGLALVYVYMQLWSLGELPRIIAAAFGLVIAVAISAVKLKDKLS